MSQTRVIYLTDSMYLQGHNDDITPRESFLEKCKTFVKSIFRQYEKTKHFEKLSQIKLEGKMIPQEPCAICLDDYSPKQYIKILPCLHYYHKHCIRQWLCERETTCPMCRSHV